MHFFITRNGDTLAFKLSVELVWDFLWFAEVKEITLVNHLSIN